MYIWWGPFPKSVNKRQADQWNIEYSNSTKMRDACAEGFLPLFWGCNAEDSLDDQNIRTGDEDRVHTNSRDHGSQPHCIVEPGVCARELHHIRVEAVGVVEHAAAAIGQSRKKCYHWRER